MSYIICKKEDEVDKVTENGSRNKNAVSVRKM